MGDETILGGMMRFQRSTILLFLGLLSLCSSPDSKAQDYSSELRPFYYEAKNRNLPTRFFEDLFEVDAWIAVRSTEGGPHYQPGYWSGGTIYLQSVSSPVQNWKALDFTNFYNELFHAWWGNAFLRNPRFEAERKKLFSNLERSNKYRRANPSNPSLAQEEAYSETVAALIMLVYPWPSIDPQTKQPTTKPTPWEQLSYKINTTVAAVSHGDRPGFTEEAEETYPDEEEYNWLFQKMFNRLPPPQVPQPSVD